MSVDGTDRRIDEKGRVTIPQEIRELLDLEPGESVHIAVQAGEIVIRPRVSRGEFIETMEGYITEDIKRDDAPEMTPADVKADWTSDLPNDG